MTQQGILMTVLGVVVLGGLGFLIFSGDTRTSEPVVNNSGTPPAPLSDKCFIGGCSGQVCSDQEGIASTCEYKPEYACYKNATCERQSDGKCGWTQNQELSACLLVHYDYVE